MAQPVGVRQRTGERCLYSGIWDPDCAGRQIALSKSEVFPPVQPLQPSGHLDSCPADELSDRSGHAYQRR